MPREKPPRELPQRMPHRHANEGKAKCRNVFREEKAFPKSSELSRMHVLTAEHCRAHVASFVAFRSGCSCGG
jgi:hypothetical protein